MTEDDYIEMQLDRQREIAQEWEAERQRTAEEYGYDDE